MLREERFHSFYRATRRRVLLQTFALTGDLPAALAATRDAYVAAWEHWRKVSRFDDPLDWVRPRAWQLAQRRHTARVWHRTRGLPEHHQAVLDGLSALPAGQRRVLLLVDLAGLEPAQAGRELGVTRAVAEGTLALAVERMSDRLGVAADEVRRRLADLDTLVEPDELPGGQVVLRAGRRRRRRHTLLAAAVAVGVALVSGAVAQQPRPDNAGRRDVRDLRVVGPAGTPSGGASAGTPSGSSAGDAPTAGSAGALTTGRELLDPDQIRRLGRAQEWRVTRTDDNTAGDGINSVCQQRRFADPDGFAAVVRSFRAAGAPPRSAVQTVEVSRSAAQARQTFRTVVGWYAGCRVGRLQILDSYRVGGVGDEATVLLLRLWRDPVTTTSVAVARTGRLTTSTVAATVGGEPPPVAEIVSSLVDSVAMLCGSSGSPECAKHPTYRRVPPPPSGEERGLLAAADLPPVGRIAQPWVGTRPTAGRSNPAATTCERADFVARGASVVRSRTYLIPQARLPAQFGLSETYGVFGSDSAASRFLAAVRRSVAGCHRRDLATTVSAERRARRASPPLDLSSWLLRTEVADGRELSSRLGFVRTGRAVAQLSFAPSPSDDMTAARFQALVVRAGERLRELE